MASGDILSEIEKHPYDTRLIRGALRQQSTTEQIMPYIERGLLKDDIVFGPQLQVLREQGVNAYLSYMENPQNVHAIQRRMEDVTQKLKRLDEALKEEYGEEPKLSGNPET